MGTYILVNHLQSNYLQALPPEEQQKLVDDTNKFVEEARPHVDGVIFAFAFNPNTRTGEAFDLDSELPDSYQEGDLMLRNDGGRGLDHDFLINMNSLPVKADNVILTGTLYDACITGTGITIRQNIAKNVTIPSDLVDQADPREGPKFREHATRQMEQAGITLGKTSAEVLAELKAPQFEYAGGTPSA